MNDHAPALDAKNRQHAGAWPLRATVTTALRLMRVEKPLCAAAFTFLGAWLGGPAAMLLSGRVIAGAVCVFLITAFGFVINDCCDLRVDAIGKPGRPLPSQRVSVRGALALAWTLALAGLAVGLTLGAVPALFAAGAVTLSTLYSVRLKNTVLWGNASVALMVSAVLIFGAGLAGGSTSAAWMAAGMSFAYILAQEALFTLEDEDEDRAAGLRTTATVLGTDRAAALVRALLLLFAVAALWPTLTGQTSAWHASTLLVVSIAPALVLATWLRAPVKRAQIARAAWWSRWVWLSSFVPLALLK